MTSCRSRSEHRRERAQEHKVMPTYRVLGYNLHCPALRDSPVEFAILVQARTH
jgi:hypothetical protein